MGYRIYEVRELNQLINFLKAGLLNLKNVRTLLK